MPTGRLVAAVPRGGAVPSEAAGRLVPGPLTQVRLVVSGVPVVELAAGTRLRIGSDVTVELTGPAAVHGGVAEAETADVVAARVLDGGPVRPGDAVTVDAVVLAPGDALDLDAFRPADVEAVVAAYLADAQASGLREVRIVHGRGRGVQRALVRRLLSGVPGIAAVEDAPPERGGWGATIVRLRSDGGAGAR